MEREEVDSLAKAGDVQVMETRMAVDLVGEDGAEVLGLMQEVLLFLNRRCQKSQQLNCLLEAVDPRPAEEINAHVDIRMNVR